MKSRLLQLWPLFLIFTVVFIFFARLLFPPSIYVTPDFGRSDLLHMSYPNKYELSKDLRGLNLSLWQNNIAQGYPIFSEAITGTFFLPNFLVFLLLPFNVALPVLHIVTFLTAAYGMYFLLRRLKLSQCACVFGAISYAFSGAMIIGISHTHIIQGLSVFPWIIGLLIIFRHKPSLKTGLGTSFLISQLFLVGFTQFFVYSGIVIFTLLALWWLFKRKTNIVFYFGRFGLIALFSLVLSAVQLLPALELTQLSQRSGGLDPATILNGFPINFENLLSYLHPFIVGSAANGTYNSPEWSKRGIFWENTGYIGLPGLFLFFGAIVYLVFKKRKEPFYFALALTCLFSLFLALGKLAPTHILFSFPPLSFFRVPARFNLFTQFIAIVLASIFLNALLAKINTKFRKLFFIGIIAFTTVNFFYVWWSYHPIGKIDDWLKKPETISALDQNTNGYRILSIDSKNNWNGVFVKNGWNGRENDYKYFMNLAMENYNSFFNVNHFDGYVVLPTRRFSLQKTVLGDFSYKDDQIIFSRASKAALDSVNVRYVISSSPVSVEGNPNAYSRIFSTERNGNKYYVHESHDYKAKFNLFYSYQKINTVNQYFEKFKDQNLDLSKTAIIEKDLDVSLEPGEGRVMVNKDINGKFELDVTTSKPALLVVSDSYYPGWKATIDGENTQIFPANINSKGILVPAGEHKVKMVYSPASFKVGGAISALGHLSLLLLLLAPKIKRPKSLDK